MPQDDNVIENWGTSNNLYRQKLVDALFVAALETLKLLRWICIANRAAAMSILSTTLEDHGPSPGESGASSTSATSIVHYLLTLSISLEPFITGKSSGVYTEILCFSYHSYLLFLFFATLMFTHVHSTFL